MTPGSLSDVRLPASMESIGIFVPVRLKVVSILSVEPTTFTRLNGQNEARDSILRAITPKRDNVDELLI
jgi:hypothetical protein